jgi:transposase-like protein
MKDSVFLYKKQLCAELGISKSTLYRWMKEAGISTNRGLFTREEADIIREKLLAREKRAQLNRNGLK